MSSVHLFICLLWEQPHSLSKKLDLFYQPTLIFGFGTNNSPFAAAWPPPHNSFFHLLPPLSTQCLVHWHPQSSASDSLVCWIQVGLPQWRALRSLDRNHLFSSPSLFGPGTLVVASSLLDDSSCFSMVSVPSVFLTLRVLVASFWGYLILPV